jgi:hypothetical protein
VLRQAVNLGFGPTPLDGQVLTIDPAELAQLISERVRQRLLAGTGSKGQISDTPHLGRSDCGRVDGLTATQQCQSRRRSSDLR